MTNCFAAPVISARLGATEAGSHPRPGHLTQTLYEEAPMPDDAFTASVDRESTTPDNMRAHAPASKPGAMALEAAAERRRGGR